MTVLGVSILIVIIVVALVVTTADRGFNHVDIQRGDETAPDNKPPEVY